MNEIVDLVINQHLFIFVTKCEVSHYSFNDSFMELNLRSEGNLGE